MEEMAETTTPDNATDHAGKHDELFCAFDTVGDVSSLRNRIAGNQMNRVNCEPENTMDVMAKAFSTMRKYA